MQSESLLCSVNATRAILLCKQDWLIFSPHRFEKQDKMRKKEKIRKRKLKKEVLSTLPCMKSEKMKLNWSVTISCDAQTKSLCITT